MNKRRTFLYIGIFAAVIFAVSYLLIFAVPSKEPKIFGVTFSRSFAEKFGTDWEKNYLAILEDLGVKNIRIPVYWPEVEPNPPAGGDKWSFDALDWQLEKAREYGAKVILVIGRKLPRWPECFEPKWLENLSEAEKQNLILEMLKHVVERYKNNPAVWAFQVENEPFLSFGECPVSSVEFLDKEISTVKRFSTKPVIVTDSGEFGTWIGAAKRGDIFGSTLYRYVYTKFFGYITYPLPPWFFRLKQGLLKLFIGEKPAIVIELQAEPWLPKMLYETSIDEHFRHFNPERLKNELEYIKNTGFDAFYFWGAEWWYWLKQNGHPEMWNIAKEVVKNTK